MAPLAIVGDGIEGYGCPSMSPIACGLINMELNRGDGSLGTFLGVQAGLAMRSIALLGSEEQKQRWLAPMARLEKIGLVRLWRRACAGMPGSGVPSAMFSSHGPASCSWEVLISSSHQTNADHSGYSPGRSRGRTDGLSEQHERCRCHDQPDARAGSTECVDRKEQQAEGHRYGRRQQEAFLVLIVGSSVRITRRVRLRGR